MNLRKTHQRERRERILDAARKLIRTKGEEGLSMRALADLAGVSLVTPYNLFGSKGEILVVLFDATLDQLAARVARVAARDPLARTLAVADTTVDIYTADSRYYRPLLKALLGSGEPIHRSFARAIEIWKSALEAAVADGTLLPRVSVELVARQLMVNCVGVLELWVHEELDDEGCRSQMLYGSMLCLRAVVDDAHARRLLARLTALQRNVPAKLLGAVDLVGARRRTLS
jgi:AcrR family transcriptional regulator